MYMNQIVQKQDQFNEVSIFGVEEMLKVVNSTPLHSDSEKIEDYGDLCDSDCVDCD